MQRRLIINADDFGLDRPATEAILRLGELRRITSTTVLANLVGDADLRALRRLPGISVGLHLNLLEGAPLSAASRIPDLLDCQGGLLGQKALLARALAGRLPVEQLEIEISAQFRRLQTAGIEPSHVDSHQHSHQYPLLGPRILDILVRLGVRRVRHCRVSDWGSPRMLVVGLFSLSSAWALRRFSHPDVLISAFSARAGAGLDRFRQAIDQVAKGNQVLEFMTHPATENSAAVYLDRAAEYQFWLSEGWREWLDAHGIDLASYRNI